MEKKIEVKEFCTNIGTKLRIFEGMKQWTDRDQFYVGLLEEGVREDKLEAPSTLVI